MLTKCANPKCSAQFRYLHEGKLFIVDRSNRPAGSQSAEQPAAEGQANDYFDYYWLCANCSRRMVVVSNKWVPQVVPFPRTRAEREQEFR